MIRRIVHVFALTLSSSFSISNCFAQGVITTVAGTAFTFRGDGGPALSAPLGDVRRVAVDPAGNLLAVDAGNHLLVKVSPAGVLTVVAGNGIAGFSGDGGAATSASLNNPWGLALDAAGNLYIADRFNNRIRKVSPSGTITTVAGSRTLSGFSGDGGPATAALLSAPFGVAVDATGNLYIADNGNHRVRKVTAAGIITTVAGNGVSEFSGDGGPATLASLSFPEGVAADAAGNLYIAERRNNRIRKVSPAGIISTVAGTGGAGFSGDGGPATGARITSPSSVFLDAGGTLYIADRLNHRIRKVGSDGIITTVAGNGVQAFSGDGGPATSASLSEPGDMAVDASGNLHVADTLNNRIRTVALDGTITTTAGNGLFKYSGDGGPATSASLSDPRDVAVDAAGNVYIADTDNHRVRKVSVDGSIATLAGNSVPGFSGDGGPAAAASLNGPAAVAVDAAGNLFIVDNLSPRIRKVSPDGTITTVAGTGTRGFSGDGGPATSAALNQPFGVAVDASGNVYIADSSNNRIRRVSPDGAINTVAGNGSASFSGDGGPAINASLFLPFGVAVDASGNIYIADRFNYRIRKVSASGIITTVAGSGTRGFSGDGGPATSAAFMDPTGVAVDGTGNLFIADWGNNRIRKVTPAGIISTVAGNGTYAFSGDGGLATNATLRLPNAVAVDGAGNLFIADSVNDRVRKVLATPPAFALAPGNLSFSAAAGAPVVAAQPIAVLSPVAGLAWTAQAATQSGGNWLSVSPAAGSTPGIIAVSVNVTGLTPGTYKGSVTVRVLLAASSTLAVAVELTVQGSVAARLTVEPLSLTFESQAGAANPPSPTLRISNAGPGTLNWTAQAGTPSGGSWLGVSPASGSASAGSPSAVQVTANLAGLPAGVYSGSVRVESPSTNQAETIAVTLLLSQVPQTILLSQTGLLFAGVEGGAMVPAQSFGIRNSGQGLMEWSVEASTFSGGNWLSVSPASGRSAADSLEIPLVQAPVNISGLGSGQYSGLVRVNAPAANNSPQFVTVDLNVLPAGSNVGVVVRPTGLIFAAQAGTSSPGSQLLRLATAKPGSVEARTGLLTEGADWLEILPRNLVLSAADPRTIVVQPNLGSLAPGVYRGSITLQFDDGSPAQVVSILFAVTSAATGAAGLLELDSGAEAAAAACVPRRLLVVHRTLGNNFVSQASWPSPLEVQVADDCGSPVPAATVVASFSSGDQPLALASLRNGTYVGTWRPLNVGAQVTVTVRAHLSSLAPAEVQVLGQVSSNPKAPALFAGGMVNAASFAPGEALAPGSIVSVFGRNLAAFTATASTVPLPTTLGGATLSVGGRDVPLFFSSGGQINAQIPFDLAPNSRPQVAVKARREETGPETITVPETITLAAARPGIFSTNQQGTGQGAILNVQGILVDSAAAAAAGEVVQVFATGLGATQPPVGSGQAAPGAEPLARVVTSVEARVGGRAANVQFAGLAPGFVGLYQVNVVIPTGVSPGSAVPLVLLQSAVSSNTVTLAVR